MQRIGVLVAFVIVGITLVPSLYGGTSGKIAGMVVDGDTGEPLVAVNITVGSTGTGAVSNIEGRYHIVNVMPGTYTVKATMMGYQAIIKEDVMVNADFTSTVDFELSPAVLDIVPEIVVTAERPMIRKDMTSSMNVIEHEEISMLPIESAFDVLSFQAGAAADRRGIHIRGGRDTEISYTVNGAPIMDPIFSKASANYDESAIQEMVVLSGGFTPEYGNAQSGIVNIVTKEGGTEFEGQLQKTFYLPLDALWKAADDAKQYDTGFGATKLMLSGPSPWTDGLKYFISGETSKWNDWDPHVYVLPHQERDLDQLTWKLTGAPGHSMKIFFEGLYYGTDFYRWDAQRQKVPDTFLKYDRRTEVGVLGLSHMISSDSYYDCTLSRFKTRYHVAQPGKWWDLSKSQEWNTTPTDEGGGGLNLSPEYDGNNFIIAGDNPLFHDSQSVIYGAKSSFTSQINEHHQFKAGGEHYIYRTTHREVYAPAGNIYRNDYNVGPRYTVAYLQDKAEYSGLVVNMGFRMDVFNPRFKVPSNPQCPWDSTLQVPGPECGGPDNTEPPLWNLKDASTKYQMSPRLGISHPVSDKTVLHFTYGHYFQMPAFSYMYTNTKFDMGGAWPLIGNPDLEPERTVSYEVGLENLVAEDLMIDLTGFYKDIDNLISTVVINDSRDPATPEWATEYTTYRNTDWGNVRGFEFALQRKFREDWMGRVSYTFMIAKGRSSDVGEGYQALFNGTVLPTREYYLDWDRRHTLVLDVGYGRRQNWAVNFLVKYASGSPYTPAENGRSQQPEQNTARFPSTSLVNMKASKDFHLYSTTQRVFLQVDNLFNKKNLVAFNDANTDLMRYLRMHGEYTGPFDDVTVFGSPREIKAGFELLF
ncbi:MAG: TonB-dependent receptor [Candidatus Eisenbacteria bacterium]